MRNALPLQTPPFLQERGFAQPVTVNTIVSESLLLSVLTSVMRGSRRDELVFAGRIQFAGAAMATSKQSCGHFSRQTHPLGALGRHVTVRAFGEPYGEGFAQIWEEALPSQTPQTLAPSRSCRDSAEQARKAPGKPRTSSRMTAGAICLGYRTQPRTETARLPPPKDSF